MLLTLMALKKMCLLGNYIFQIYLGVSRIKMRLVHTQLYFKHVMLTHSYSMLEKIEISIFFTQQK